MARKVVDLLADRQAEDIILLDISQVAGFADYFVIASAINPRHMRALLETLDKDLEAEAARALHQEGTAESGWVLLDLGDVIVHLFSPEERSYYDLEALWSEGVAVVHIQ
jgi:ribosome-associated protein